MATVPMTPGRTTLVPTDRLRRGAVERAATPGVDARALEKELRRSLEGEVGFDEASRALYAQDASNYRFPPLGVVVPRSREEIARTIAICRSFDAPVVARGGGTALAGQGCNHAVVIDASRYVNRILSVEPASRIARVEPGVVCDQLVAEAERFGLTFGPKPATHDRCCFGGMLSNNCGGMEAQIHGIAVHNVEAMDIVLYDGTQMTVGWMNEGDLAAAIDRGGREGTLFAGLRALRDRYASLVRERFPRLPRRVSGYNLDQLLPGDDGRFNIARVLVGSEGTLATMLEATVRLVPSPPCRAVVILGYEDLGRAADAVTEFLPHAPTKLEAMDSVLRDQITEKGGKRARFEALLPKGEAWLFVEVGGGSRGEARERAEAVLETAKRRSGEGLLEARVLMDPKEQDHVWKVREAGLGATAFVPGEPDTWPGWEDSAVPPERLGGYVRDLRGLLDRYRMRASLYGHFGMGCVHCRLPFDLMSHHGVEAFRRFMRDAAELVVRHGGSLSGEHGDGQSRAELLPIMFGEELVQAFRELKTIWDPLGKMNPGRIVDPYPLDHFLRLGASYTPRPLDTYFRYPDDGGSFGRATLRCVGVGKCRRASGEGEDDTMCPSYMVTREERHSTRGRAHLLWEMQRSDSLLRAGWREEGVKEALDLCLACKGCKGDCPVNVDVATLKAEFFAHYYERRRRPRHAWAFGFVDVWARAAAIAPGLVNLTTQLPGLRRVAKWAAGVSQDASIPALAPRTFRALFREHTPRRVGDRTVVLWPDTFNAHFHPDTLMAAVHVLEAAGFDVVIPERHVCCGRPLYDFGFLDRAKGYLRRSLDTLAPYLDEDCRVVVLEPSCASVFRDELPNLLPASPETERATQRVVLLSELLQGEAHGLQIQKLVGDALVQGHCHHKSVLGFDPECEVLDRTGLNWRMSDGGCCGMAGSFGLVDDTHEVGKACGERALLPKVREAPPETFVLADGFSCREQIAQRTDRTALHLAEVLRMGIDPSVRPAEGEPRPEGAIVAARRRGAWRSMIRAATAIAACVAFVAVGVGVTWARKRTAPRRRV